MYSRLLLPIIIFFLALFASCSNNEQNFKIVGHIDGMPSQSVFLEELNPVNDVVVLDSTHSDDKGQFELSGSASEPGLYRLRFDQNQFILLSITEKGTVKVNGNWENLYNYTVNGSPASEGLRMFLSNVREHLRDFNTMSVVLDSLQAKGNDSMLGVAQKDLQDMNFDFTRYIEQYADTTPYLPNALFAVQMLNPAAESQYLQAFTQNLTSRFPNSKLAKDFSVKVNKMLAGPAQSASSGTLDLGATAPEITLPTADGKQVALSSFRGKYVLVDFWASWCGPCRAENPNVVAAYNKYKDKNFTVLGVSLDNDKDKWQQAIQKDHLTWTHISDLKGWESVAARDYNIEAIPSNFLIDPQGKIVAHNLRGEALQSKLAEIFQ